MKKLIAFLLAAIMLLSLCACGNSDSSQVSSDSMDTSGKSDSSQVSSDSLIGTWTCKREAGQDNVTMPHTKTIELYVGGNCYKYDLGTDNEKYNNNTGKWVLEDNLLTITLATGAVQGYVLNTETTPFSLTMQMDDSIVLVKSK